MRENRKQKGLEKALRKGTEKKTEGRNQYQLTREDKKERQ
jgi:hypothetical protein